MINLCNVQLSDNVFCTLFDSGYLDKGIALCNSLHRVSPQFLIYVLAFDDECFRVMSDVGLKNVHVISMSEFETEYVMAAKMGKTHREYCWMCSSLLIKHILNIYNEKMVTYIDADMFFYASPDVLLTEFLNSGKSVGIMEHRFPKVREAQELIEQSGRFCVEFNTFINDKEGNKVLEQWCTDCITKMSEKASNGFFGDQKFLDMWPERYDCIHIYDNVAAGVAPWNIHDYVLDEENGKITYVPSSEQVDLIFYHFHAIKFVCQNEIALNIFERYSRLPDRGLVDGLYREYFKALLNIIDLLDAKYSFNYWGNCTFEKKRTKVRKIVSMIHFRNGEYRFPIRKMYRCLRFNQDDYMQV